MSQPRNSAPKYYETFKNKNGDVYLTVEWWSFDNFFLSLFPGRFEITFNHWPENLNVLDKPSTKQAKKSWPLLEYYVRKYLR